jgi:hypothetical protein
MDVCSHIFCGYVCCIAVLGAVFSFCFVCVCVCVFILIIICK